MVIGVRVEPELEQRLDLVARSLGKSRSACVREAIRLYVQYFADDAEAKRQSALIQAQGDGAHWSEQLPDWSDWTA
ncbi:MAG: ribbon-helix-helix protein, CopG family [Synechococcus lacustris]|jgi:predicted DNA-binding protein